jgi:hypothetical protein
MQSLRWFVWVESRAYPGEVVNKDLEEYLGRLDRLAESLPEGHTVRKLVEDATRYARNARAHDAGKAGEAAGRSRSKTEGRISTLRGVLSREDTLADREA